MKKINVKDIKIIETNETMGKAFVIWPIEGIVFKDGRELGQTTIACTLDVTIEDICQEMSLPMSYVASYIETPAMPIENAIAFCKMMERRYEAPEMEYTSYIKVFSDEHGLGFAISE